MSERASSPSIFRAMPGYPWLDPCPRCGFRGSCDCTVYERARAAHPGLVVLNAQSDLRHPPTNPKGVETQS